VTHFFVSHVSVNSDMCAWVPREDEYLRNKLAIIYIRDGLLGWVICTENLFSFII